MKEVETLKTIKEKADVMIEDVYSDINSLQKDVLSELLQYHINEAIRILQGEANDEN